MKNTHIIILFFMISIGISSCITSKKEVDLILYNAKVYTVDSAFSIQECVVIDSGYILETGQQDVLLKKYNTKKSIDLKGKYVYPGFIDAHCHFYGYAIDQLEADVADTKSFDEVIAILQKFRKENKSKWIVGRGWDQNDWEVKEFPTKSKLDSIFKDIPVFITRVDGHAALVNSKALEIAGITKGTKIEGGKIYLHNNEPSGILIDNAIELVSKHIPKTSVEDSKIALITAAEKCFAVGLTSVGDAGLDKEMVLLIDSLHKKGELKMKIYAMLNPTTENLETFMNKGTYKTPYLNIRSVKLFADGALGSRGACLLEPYSDDADNYGIIMNKESYYREICEQAYKKRYQINTHVIGDSAMRMMLNIYSTYLKSTNDLRWRIEHAQVVSPVDLSKFATYTIIPAVNTVHATSDMYWAEKRLGPNRIKYAYAYKDLLTQNGWLCNGSDFPVEKTNPLLGFYAAVSRKDLQQFPENGFQKENALTRTEALKAMTIWAAKSFFEENEKGSIEKGKYADIVVADQDLMSVEEHKIPNTKIIMTFINGQLVYSVK